MEQNVEQVMKQFDKQLLWLKGSLEQEIKNGIRSLGIAFVRKDGSIGYAHAALDPFSLIGVMEALKKQIVDSIEVQTERKTP